MGAAMGGNDSAIMDRSLDMGTASVDSNKTKDGHRNSTMLQGGMQQKAQRVHHVMSDPSLRASGPQPIIESAREPKFFGTMPRAFSETGVRSGGFQRLDWPSHNARPGGPAPPSGDKKRGGDTRRNESKDHKMSKDTMHSSSIGTAQP